MPTPSCPPHAVLILPSSLTLSLRCPPHILLLTPSPSCHPTCVSCCPPHAALLVPSHCPLTLSLPRAVVPSPSCHPSVLLVPSAPCCRLPSAVPSRRHTMLSPSHHSQCGTSRHHPPIKAIGQASKLTVHLAYPHLRHVQQMANQHSQAMYLVFPISFFPRSSLVPNMQPMGTRRHGLCRSPPDDPSSSITHWCPIAKFSVLSLHAVTWSI